MIDIENFFENDNVSSMKIQNAIDKSIELQKDIEQLNYWINVYFEDTFNVRARITTNVDDIPCIYVRIIQKPYMEKIKEIEKALNLKCFQYSIEQIHRGDGRIRYQEVSCYFALEQDYARCDESNNYDCECC